MVRPITLATCALNQWALDYDGNKARILESIAVAKARGAAFRLGPELEITGYGCNDHFLEPDTFAHAWEVLAEIIAESPADIAVDVGLPIMHKSVRYNCRVIFLNRQILLIRPKQFLAQDGCYREARFFTAWAKPNVVEDFCLPAVVRAVTSQTHVKFGDGVVAFADTAVAPETCEELFTPNSPSIHKGLDGAEIFTNGSGSHHELRKLHTRVDLILGITRKVGGVYMYANQCGCDGERVYYDGCAMICINGDIVAQGEQFSLLDVEVVTATVDLDTVDAFRGSIQSRGVQGSLSTSVPRVFTDTCLASGAVHAPPMSRARAPVYVSPEEEIARGPACWLWDYLRRASLGGYFLPLSGGIDSSSTATIVHSMCRMVHEACEQGNEQVLRDVRRLCDDPELVLTDPQHLASLLFYTAYLGTENSSRETRARAKNLAAQIGSYHLDLNIDAGVTAIVSIFELATGKLPRFSMHGGEGRESLALQNIQARLRMLLSYMFAQLLPWVRGRRSGLLVLGSANVDECLRGYLTKYDCSAADVNPIGGISKTDLRRFILFAEREFGLTELASIHAAPPTAELLPITDSYTQTDEEDMGMTYAELSEYGILRKVKKCGPFSMFVALCDKWSDQDPAAVAAKVKFFFRMYAINRHKSTVLTPSYHAENYAPDDNRFDLRPFLYNVAWPWQFRAIDAHVLALKAVRSLPQGSSTAL